MNLTRAWQRVQVTGTNQNGLAHLYLQIGGGSTFPAGQIVYVWGAEMVMGSASGPPVQTLTATTNDATGSTVDLTANGLNQSYSYDSFGNIQQSGNYNFAQSYTSNNQLSGWAYDQSGNLLNDGFNSYIYDAEGRISGMNLNTNLYVYDAEGQRVNNGATGTDHVFFGGREVTRFAGGQWTDLIYGTGGLLAEIPGTQAGSPVYRMTDHLGSPVGTLNSSGVLLSTTDYAPFGQVITGGTNDPYQFTGKERDNESGNDYFGARYYASSMGRFMSADPLYLEMHRLADPQQLNLYVYGRDNPLHYTDSTGLDVNLDCSGVSAGACSKTVDDLNNRQGAQFSVSRNSDTGLLQVDGKVDSSKLSSSESALYGAITDTDHHATLSVTSESGDVQFGRFDGHGHNTLDRSDLNLLGNVSQQAAGQVIAHEALEAYDSSFLPASLSSDVAYGIAHGYATQFFGEGDTTGPLPTIGSNPPAFIQNWTLTKLGFTFTVKTLPATPQPNYGSNQFITGKIVDIWPTAK